MPLDGPTTRVAFSGWPSGSVSLASTPLAGTVSTVSSGVVKVSLLTVAGELMTAVTTLAAGAVPSLLAVATSLVVAVLAAVLVRVPVSGGLTVTVKLVVAV